MVKIFKSPIFWIFFLSVLLRFWLAVVNRDANDNHVDVIIRILLHLPAGNTVCPECYQPKFWYSLVAIIAKFFMINNVDGLIVLSQFVNFFAGVATIIFIWKFIKEITSSRVIQYLTFGLIAFNPDLLAINGQGTNDSFVICFGVLTTYFLWKFMNTNKFVYMLPTSLLMGFAIVTKGSGLIVGAVVLFCLFINLFLRRKYLTSTLYALLLSFCVSIIAIFFFSPYYHYFQTYGRFDVINEAKAPPAQFFKETVAMRPGIMSIASGYFTFHFFDLLQTPYTQNGRQYTPQRTSLWTQLYGRAFSSHFPQWPPSWADTTGMVITVTWLIIIFALFPSVVFLVGFLQTLLTVLKGEFVKELSWIFVITWIAFICMIIIYTYEYRDYSFMKTIFLYPALLSIVYFLVRGFEYIIVKLKNSAQVVRVGNGIFIFFICLEIMDILLLIFHLQSLQ